MTSGFKSAVGAYLVWGLAPLFWRQLDSVPSDQITALRFVQVVLITAAVLWFGRGVSLLSLFTDRRVARFHLMAGALLAVNWTVYVYAVATDRVIDASLGYFINPLMSILIGLFVLGESIDKSTWAAIGVVAIGVGILTVEAGTLPWISFALAFSFALYGLLKKKSTLGPFEGLATEMTWMTPFAIGYLMWLVSQGSFTLGSGTFGSGGAPLYIWGIGLITALPLLLFGRAAKTVPLWMLGLLQFLAPTISFGLGAFVFDEPVSGLRLAGFVVIWIGLAISCSHRIPVRPSDREARLRTSAPATAVVRRAAP